jgi:hypothetical protein
MPIFRQLLLVGCLGSFFAAASAAPQVFLVQNSGWMAPFYGDPNSNLKPLVNALMRAVTAPGEEIFVAAFSQATPENPSPLLVFPNDRGLNAEQAVAAIAPARKSASGALADTDFEEAVTRILAGPLQNRSAILWIFTNNKNSPNNSPETVRLNQEFYNLLHKEPAIVKTLVFPLKMPVKGNRYQANGLMVYALAYGREAEAHLDRLAREGRLGQVFTDPPARLKPLDRESVRLTPREIRNAPGISIGLDEDGRTVALDVEVSVRQPSVEILAGLENLFYPYLIETAEVSAKFSGEGWESPLTATPNLIRALSPGARQDIAVVLPIPLARIPSVWSPESLRSMGKRYTIPGTLEIALSGQTLSLAETFRNRLRDLFPGDPISEVFTPPLEVQSSVARIPFLIRVRYPVYPLWIIGLGGLLGLLLSLWLMARFWRRRFVVRIDGRARTLTLTPWQTEILRGDKGEKIGEIRRGFFRAAVVFQAPGRRVELGD